MIIDIISFSLKMKTLLVVLILTIVLSTSINGQSLTSADLPTWWDFDFSEFSESVPDLTDQQILQQTLNGLFEQNKLPDPKTIVACFDAPTAHKTVVFIGQLLDKAAKGSLQDLLSLKKLVEDFGANFDPKAKACLDGNAEFTTLGNKYGVNGSSSADIEKKLITYVTLHYLEVHGWLVSLDKNWKTGKFYQTGFDAAGYGHKILKISGHSHEDVSDLTLSDKDILQQLFNGLFEPNKMSDPTTIVPCFDDDSAKKTVVFAGNMLHLLATATLTNPAVIQKIKDEAKAYSDSLPEAVKKCLDDNQQLKALGVKYGIDDKTDKDAMEKKVLTYVALHYLSVHKSLQQFDNDWHKGAYKNVGTEMAKFGHAILNLTKEDIRKLVYGQ